MVGFAAIRRIAGSICWAVHVHGPHRHVCYNLYAQPPNAVMMAKFPSFVHDESRIVSDVHRLAWA